MGMITNIIGRDNSARCWRREAVFVLEAPAGEARPPLSSKWHRAQRGIPILVDLPRWVRSGLDILDYLARIPAFRARGIEAWALTRSPNDEPYLFLLNGWNEISTLRSEEAADLLRNVALQFPAAGILVATRAHHIVPHWPHRHACAYFLSSPDQRFGYLVETGGNERANHGLGDHIA